MENTSNGITLEKCSIGGRGGARSGAGRKLILKTCNHCNESFGTTALRKHRRVCQLEMARAARAEEPCK